LATDGYALLAEYGGDAGLGDAVARADLLRRVSGLVFLHDLGDIAGGQEALRTGDAPWLRNRRARIGDP